MKSILLVEDDDQSVASTAKILEMAGYSVDIARNGEEGLAQFRPGSDAPNYDCVVSDIRMPKMDGLEFLRTIRTMQNNVPFVIMTAYGEVNDAVFAMKFGASDFLTKPFKRNALLESVETAMLRVKSTQNISKNNEKILGSSSSTKELRVLVEQIARTDATALITGESGTGKELVARQIHDRSSRSKRPFIDINCAAIPENLIESELFGHEKGAFSGAVYSKRGLFDAANGGTLFLDEIGDMPMSAQSKLLRVLQEGEIRKVGSTETRKIDVRVVAATHRNLQKRVEQGFFRQDLLFRLDVVSLSISPLRDRAEDIPELACFFLSSFSQRHGKDVFRIEPDAMRALSYYQYPGNVRELANSIERAVIFSDSGEIQKKDLPFAIRNFNPDENSTEQNISIPIGMSLKDVEELLIKKTLEITNGDKRLAARLLGVNSRTIYRRAAKDN